jgi:hypothetical protein
MRLTPDQAAIAAFLAKFADFSYARKEAAEQLDPSVPIENGWLVYNVRSVGDPVSGLDFTMFSRIRDSGALDIAVALRGAQVTWRPQLADVGAGLRRGLPQWRQSRDLFLRKLLTPCRSALRSGGHVYITGQSMGHMLVQFAGCDLVQSLAADPQLAKCGTWTLERVAGHIHVYGFGGVGVAEVLGKVGLDPAALEPADVKHFVDRWDPAQLLWWRYAGDQGRTWTAPKPYPQVRTAWQRALWGHHKDGVKRFNILFPFAFLWHLFYTAHSVTGYNESDFARSQPRA